MKNRKKNTKLILLLLLVCITLGYAALRTGLNINGTANVSSSSWNVHFENYQMSNATNITPTTEPSISGTTTTSISYEVDLDVPGDLYEFSVEVVNGGSLDANISLVYKYNGSEISQSNPVPAYIDYVVSDENGDPIVDNHRLNHGERETVKVFVKYKDTDPSILPSSSTTLSFDIEIEATQAEKEPVETGNYVVSVTEMYMGQTIPQVVPVRSIPTLAMADWSTITGVEGDTRPFYLKHILNGNDEIEETYLGFVITDAMKAQLKNDKCSGSSECETQIDNLINGTYYIRGGVAEGYEPTQPIYEANKNVIKTAFNYAIQPGVCNSYSGYLLCEVSGLSVSSDWGGTEYVGDIHAGSSNGSNCYVSGGEGSYSYCW